MNNNTIITLLVIAGAAIGIFLLLREIMIWYYKIDKRIILHEETNSILKKALNYKCKNCSFETKEYSHFCPICDKDGVGKTKEDYKENL